MRLVKADCNKNYAVTPEAVSEAIATDLLSGLIPFFICATVSNKHYFVICKLPRADLEYLFVNLTIAMFPGVTIVIVLMKIHNQILHQNSISLVMLVTHPSSSSAIKHYCFFSFSGMV